ncbi:OX-2 membrane glycoprotein-like [Phyllopteryx taeniolatus]|uniref:OX-2 membrane glycoprotein-like n=1 Tax=Phyllopteryx taeniolatus TaxID=161469 RepID=UPI002AD22018|nr:OX-2 membrane glycoprotein-like [Phyllopteryx taeniolatus]
MLQQLLLVTLLFRAGSPQMSAFGDTPAEYGEDAHFKCELHDQKGVHQVTWQRRLRDHSVENVASYSRRFGQHVNEPYRGKVVLTETSLSSASLTLKNVTWADELCYICIFNVYPGESKRKQICLTVEGISEVKAKVYHPGSGLADGSASVVFSCSATGKPAPTIRWRFTPDAAGLQQPAATALANDDGTFTSAQNVTLRVSQSWQGHADCAVRSGSRAERTERVPFAWNAGSEKEAGETGEGVSSTWQIILIVLAVLGVMALIFLGIVRRLTRTWKRKNVSKVGRAACSDSGASDGPTSRRDPLHSPTLLAPEP